MTLPKQRTAYTDCLTLLDQALASPKGISVEFPSYGAAMNFRQRCYAIRNILREEAKGIFAPSDPQWGRSAYDELTIPNFEKASPCVLTIRKVEVAGKVEELK